MPACPPGPAVPVASAGDPGLIGIVDSGVVPVIGVTAPAVATSYLAPRAAGFLGPRLRDVDVEQPTGGLGT